MPSNPCRRHQGIDLGAGKFELLGKNISHTWRGCLSRSNKAMRDGILLSEAIMGDGARIFRNACWMASKAVISNATAQVTAKDSC